jgi:hypothetical protein
MIGLWALLTKITAKSWIAFGCGMKPVPAHYCSGVLGGVAFNYASSSADLRVSFNACLLRLQPHECRNQDAINLKRANTGLYRNSEDSKQDRFRHANQTNSRSQMPALSL